MSNVVKARIVRIGNSRGVRIPKLWLEQLHLGEEVELAVETDQLVIRPAHRPRHGWEDQFAAMHQREDDRLVAGFPPSAWDDREWEW